MARKQVYRSAPLPLYPSLVILLLVIVIFTFSMLFMEKNNERILAENERESLNWYASYVEVVSTGDPGPAAESPYALLRDHQQFALYFLGDTTVFVTDTGDSSQNFFNKTCSAMRSTYAFDKNGNGLIESSEKGIVGGRLCGFVKSADYFTTPSLRAGFFDFQSQMRVRNDYRLVVYAPGTGIARLTQNSGAFPFDGSYGKNNETFIRSVRDLMPNGDIILVITDSDTDEHAAVLRELASYYSLPLLDMKEIFAAHSTQMLHHDDGTINEDGVDLYCEGLMALIAKAYDENRTIPALPEAMLYER